MSSLDAFIAQLQSDPPRDSQVRACLTLPPTAPSLGVACETHVPAWLALRLHAQGIDRLTDDQEHTLRLLHQHQHVCLAAPAGTGRRVVRLLALYEALVTAGGQGHALCIFPEKHRQLAELKTLTLWNESLPLEHRLTAASYDGDTPKTQRRAIKQAPPHLILTTPEMLHAGILAYHGGWRSLFQGLRYLVLVDLHVCAGALGAHLAHLWRRLYRLSNHYGARPQTLITSAPLGNIHDVATSLTGHTCAVVTAKPWRRQSQTRVLLETTGDLDTLTHDLVSRLRTLHLQSMVIRPDSRERPLSGWPAGPQALIFPGVPEGLTQLHEHLARHANGFQPGINILLLRRTTPLASYLLHYPAAYQDLWKQDLPLHPHNPQVVQQHLLCAAAELALAAGEPYSGIHGLHGHIQQLAATNALVRRVAARQWVATQPQPHRRMRLRSYQPPMTVVHQHDGHLLTTLTPERAFRQAFEGAIIDHDAQAFHVERYLRQRHRIVVRPVQATYRTRGLLQTRVSEQRLEASTTTQTYRLTYGTLTYHEALPAFARLDPCTQARLSLHALSEHQRQFHTQGVWMDVLHPHPSPTALHTLVHAVLAVLPLLLLGDSTGLRAGVEPPGQGDSHRAALFVDASVGGNGMSACLYRLYERALRIALQLLVHCNCQQGCKRCVAALSCDACETGIGLQRQDGIRLLQRLLGEVVPSFPAVANAAAPPDRPPHHVYLCLSTQKSVEAVGGWQQKHLLGLGMAVTYDTHAGQYHVYTAETVDALFRQLRTADLVVGFNLRDFDYQVLQPYSDVPLATLPTLAILDDIQQILGFRLPFSHVVRETLGIERPDDSVDTVQWLQAGQRDRVIDHCRRDLDLLRQLVHHGSRTGRLHYRDRAGGRGTVSVNWQMVLQDG